jgi:hypothetical protein
VGKVKLRGRTKPVVAVSPIVLVWPFITVILIVSNIINTHCELPFLLL